MTRKWIFIQINIESKRKEFIKFSIISESLQVSYFKRSHLKLLRVLWRFDSETMIDFRLDKCLGKHL